MAMDADISVTGEIRSRGGRIRVWLVREVLEPPRVSGIGSFAVRDQVHARRAVGEPHQVKSWCSRRQRKIGDPDDVALNDSLAMLFQRTEGALQQIGIQLAIGPLRKDRCG